MFNKKISAILTLSYLLPAITFAATPTAFMENSQTVATGQRIQVFRVPTRDINGAIKYYDLNIFLNVKNNGTIDPIATGVPAVNASSIVATASPVVQGSKFIPGTTYKDPSGTITCRVDVATLVGGRSQAVFSCKNSSAISISMKVVTGPIIGHPYQPDLTSAGIDTIPGNANLSWGKVDNASASTWFSCINTGNIISATQVGSSINISGYNNGKTQKCGTTLTKQ